MGLQSNPDRFYICKGSDVAVIKGFPSVVSVLPERADIPSHKTWEERTSLIYMPLAGGGGGGG